MAMHVLMNYYVFNGKTCVKLFECQAEVFDWLTQAKKFWQGPIQSCNRPHDLSQVAVSSLQIRHAFSNVSLTSPTMPQCLRDYLLSSHINEPRHDKTNKVRVRPAKIQISLKSLVLGYPLNAQRRR